MNVISLYTVYQRTSIVDQYIGSVNQVMADILTNTSADMSIKAPQKILDLAFLGTYHQILRP